MENRIVTIEEVKAKTPERFWSKIKFGQPNDCWEWIASINKITKYAGFSYSENKKEKYANSHRYIYLSLYPIFNKNLYVLHSCDNRICVNPNHLRFGTHKENMEDKIKRGRQAMGERGGNSKLKTEDIIEIKKQSSMGFSSRFIAKKFSVDKSTILRIRNGEIWAHLKNKENDN